MGIEISIFPFCSVPPEDLILRRLESGVAIGLTSAPSLNTVEYRPFLHLNNNDNVLKQNLDGVFYIFSKLEANTNLTVQTMTDNHIVWYT